MDNEFKSPIFGVTRHATDEEREQIAKIVSDTPVAVFQGLNRKLNTLGLCLQIARLGEE